MKITQNTLTTAVFLDLYTSVGWEPPCQEQIETALQNTSGLMPIDLAIDLPPAHFGAQNKAFLRHFKRKEPVYFFYRERASANRCGSPFLEGE